MRTVWVVFSPEFDEPHLRAFLRFVRFNDGSLDRAPTKLLGCYYGEIVGMLYEADDPAAR